MCRLTESFCSTVSVSTIFILPGGTKIPLFPQRPLVFFQTVTALSTAHRGHLSERELTTWATEKILLRNTVYKCTLTALSWTEMAVSLLQPAQQASTAGGGKKRLQTWSAILFHSVMPENSFCPHGAQSLPAAMSGKEQAGTGCVSGGQISQPQTGTPAHKWWSMFVTEHWGW